MNTKNTLFFIKNEFKGKLEITNNKTENYLGNTLNNILKDFIEHLKGIYLYYG